MKIWDRNVELFLSTMGRNKIVIQPLTNERNRQATFTKRKNGLLKKAMELSILCSCDVVMLVVSDNKLYEYSSQDLRQVMQSYETFEKVHEPLNNSDYDSQFRSNKAQPKKKKETVSQPQRVPAPPVPSNYHPSNPVPHPDNSSYQMPPPTSNIDLSNMYSVTNRKREPIEPEEPNPALTPRTVQKYRMANKKYEDLLSNIGGASQTKPEFSGPSMFPSVVGRNVERRNSDGEVPRESGNSLPRKRQRFDTKKLTIKVPKYTNKEERAPVPVDEQRERNSAPHLMMPGESYREPSDDFSSADFPSMTPTLNILSSELALDGFSPLPITPSSSANPIWPWTPTPKVPSTGAEYNNYNIEPPLKRRKY